VQALARQEVEHPPQHLRQTAVVAECARHALGGAVVVERAAEVAEPVDDAGQGEVDLERLLVGLPALGQPPESSAC
jgi:hypothetical protein